MTDLTPESPADRLYAALHNISGQWLRDEKKLTPYLADGLTRLSAEHERILAERLAAVVAERDAAIAERDLLRAAVQEISRQKKTTELETEYDVEHADFEGGYDLCIDRARAALNPEVES